MRAKSLNLVLEDRIQTSLNMVSESAARLGLDHASASASARSLAGICPLDPNIPSISLPELLSQGTRHTGDIAVAIADRKLVLFSCSLPFIVADGGCCREPVAEC